MNVARRGFLAGVCAGAAATWIAMSAAALVAGSGADAGAQAPAAAKYTSRVVFENQRVRVRDVTFPPGVMDTGMHTHAVPHVGVILSDGALRFSEAGKPTETVTFTAGAVGYREANVTHEVANPGSAPMRVIEVELK